MSKARLSVDSVSLLSHSQGKRSPQRRSTVAGKLVKTLFILSNLAIELLLFESFDRRGDEFQFEFISNQLRPDWDITR